jgi:hypothetical protein
VKVARQGSTRQEHSLGECAVAGNGIRPIFAEPRKLRGGLHAGCGRARPTECRGSPIETFGGGQPRLRLWLHRPHVHLRRDGAGVVRPAPRWAGSSAVSAPLRWSMRRRDPLRERAREVRAASGRHASPPMEGRIARPAYAQPVDRLRLRRTARTHSIRSLRERGRRRYLSRRAR